MTVTRKSKPAPKPPVDNTAFPSSLTGEFYMQRTGTTTHVNIRGLNNDHTVVQIHSGDIEVYYLDESLESDPRDNIINKIENIVENLGHYRHIQHPRGEANDFEVLHLQSIIDWLVGMHTTYVNF